VRTIIPQFEKTTNAQTLVVGADTLVFLDGEALGKPIDEQDAFRMLTALQGRMHQVYTGLAVVDTVSGSECVDFRMTHVHMKSLTAEQIGRYIATGEPMDKAGSYAVQGLGAVFVERIEGCYFNVVGLPVSLLAAMLDKFEAVVL
jgi:septum formation protein